MALGEHVRRGGPPAGATAALVRRGTAPRRPGPARAADRDPGRRHLRRRGRPGRHPGERGLAAVGPGDRLRRRPGPARAGRSRRGRRRPRARPAAPAATQDRPPRPAEPVGLARPADRDDGPGWRRAPQFGRPDRARAAAAGPRRFHGRALPLGALAGVLRPHRWLPAPPLDPQRRDARDRGAAHRYRARSSARRWSIASSSSSTSATSRR